LSAGISQLLQLILNGLMAGSVLALPAIGLTTIFAIRRYLNFSIAGHMSIGAYAGYVVNVALGWPSSAALLVAFLVAGGFGIVTDYVALRPIMRFGLTLVSVASIALNLVLENFVRFFFASDIRSYDIPIARDWSLGSLRIGPQTLEALVIALAIVVVLFLFLALTPLGKAMRAVGDNPVLADIKGIDPERMGRIATFVAMGLCGTGGMLLGLETSIDPELGFHVLLSVFAASVVGGLGSIPGAVLGAMFIGIFEELSLVAVSPSYRSVMGFVAILLMLLVRPQGILGPGRS
jgi:branched-chain amino acid transport system permease protein